jgi:hypothetical protein
MHNDYIDISRNSVRRSPKPSIFEAHQKGPKAVRFQSRGVVISGIPCVVKSKIYWTNINELRSGNMW